jgi:hypothetical protein
MEWLKKSGNEYLNFTFEEKLIKKNAIAAIEKWREAFQSKSGEKIVLVWDCLKMTGYDKESRILWQNALNEMKDQIAGIWLITRSNLIQVGAGVLSVFTSLEIHSVSSMDEVEIEGYG